MGVLGPTHEGHKPPQLLRHDQQHLFVWGSGRDEQVGGQASRAVRRSAAACTNSWFCRSAPHDRRAAGAASSAASSAALGASQRTCLILIIAVVIKEGHQLPPRALLAQRQRYRAQPLHAIEPQRHILVAKLIAERASGGSRRAIKQRRVGQRAVVDRRAGDMTPR